MLLSLAQFNEELLKSKTGYILFGKEVAKSEAVLEVVAPLVLKFINVFPDELLEGLPLCVISSII